jgi:cytochrome P450
MSENRESEVRFDPYAYETHEDPYPIYRRLREQAPVYWNDEIGFWAFSRHADVLEGFKNTVRYSNKGGVSLEQDQMGDPSSTTSFLAMDPPRHTKMRGLVSRGFTPRRVAALEPKIRALAVHYISTFLDQGRCDFIESFAGKLPMDVISEMLGVRQEDRDMLRTWADLVLHREEGVAGVPKEGLEASLNIVGYFDELVKERKRHHGDDLVSALLDAEIDGERLADRDVIAFLFLMIIAGNETTTKLLGNMLYWIERNPRQHDKVRDDPSTIPLWVEETLRYDNSSQALMRTVAEAHEVRGKTLRKGDRVLLLVGSANRDDEVFERPDDFDVERDTTASLSFGRGTHFCLGASLARLEARVSLEEFQKVISDFRVEESGLVRVHSSNVRGFASVPIEFTRRGAR